MVSRCDKCWPPHGEPPYEWNRKAAPHIPKEKDELLKALSSIFEKETKAGEFAGLTKEELKAIYRRRVRGEKHGCDPTQGITNKDKSTLQSMNKEHGLPTAGTRGDLMLQLREHWQGQCELARDAFLAETSASSEEFPKGGTDSACGAQAVDGASVASVSTWSVVDNEPPVEPPNLDDAKSKIMSA